MLPMLSRKRVTSSPLIAFTFILPLLAGIFLPQSARAASTPAPAQFDVVVYGGVPGGITSAIAAARGGASVVLIEPTRHVGGLSTSGINTAETEHMLKWTIGGLALDFYQRLGKTYKTNKPEFYFESSVAEKVYNQMLAEAKVRVLFGYRLKGVEKEGTKIRRITLSDGSAVEGKVFIDATYEGDLMARAGVGCTWGRESRDEYGESYAGIRLDPKPRKAATVDEKGNLLPGISAWARDIKEGAADRKVMCYNFRLTCTRTPEYKVPIPEPKHYDRNRYKLLENWLKEKGARHESVKLRDMIDFYSRRNGKFEMNNTQAAIISLGHFGGQFGWPDASDEERERIYADHLDYTLGLLHFLATDEAVPPNVRAEMKQWGLDKREFADNGNLPYYLYVREGRRMKGAYVMTQKDVRDERRKPDSIGMSSHFVDCHHVERVALSESEFVNEGRIWQPSRAYEIPYRALTPKKEECANLLVPVAASFSHVAYCSFRLESVWMIAGHAAGTAAAMAASQGKSVQDVAIKPLQEKLKAQRQVVNFIPGQPEVWQGKQGGWEYF